MTRVPIELHRYYALGHDRPRPKGWIDGQEVTWVASSFWDDTHFTVELNDNDDLLLPFDTRVMIDEASEPEWNREIRQMRRELGENE